MTRRCTATIAGALTVLAGVAAASVLLLASSGGSSSASESAIPGVTKQTLTSFGLTVSSAAGTAKIDSEDAMKIALRTRSDVKVLDATLVRIDESGDDDLPAGTVAWAVRFDPDTFPPVGPMGIPPEGHTWPPTKTVVAVSFVDAETGEELFHFSFEDFAEPTPDWLAGFD